MKRKLFWFLVLCALVAVLIGVPTGWAGRAVGAARVLLFPRDVGLLSFVDREAKAVAIFQVPLFAFDRSFAGRARALADDLQEITGVRPQLDVDTILISEGLGVARGRFDWGRTSARLRDNGYTLGDSGGHAMATKGPHGDTIAFADPYLIYGHESAVMEAISRRADGRGIGEGQTLLGDLDELGWRHAALGAVKLGSDQRSVGDVLSGSAALRGFGLVADARDSGFSIAGFLRPGSRNQAKDIQGLAVEAKKKLQEALAEKPNEDAKELLGMLSKTEIRVNDEGLVLVHTLLPRGLLERATSGQTQLPELGKSLLAAGLLTAFTPP